MNTNGLCRLMWCQAKPANFVADKPCQTSMFRLNITMGRQSQVPTPSFDWSRVRLPHESRQNSVSASLGVKWFEHVGTTRWKNTSRLFNVPAKTHLCCKSSNIGYSLTETARYGKWWWDMVRYGEASLWAPLGDSGATLVPAASGPAAQPWSPGRFHPMNL